MSDTPNVPHAGSHVHPTALISPDAVLGEDVVVGPYSIIEGRVRVGAGTILHARSHLIGPLVIGEGNEIYSNALIGEKPQHFMYKNEPTSVEIGDNNIIRENVTIHRGTTGSWSTKIGSGNYLMAGAHVAHDCRIGNKCILANNSLVAGHVEFADSVYISGNAAVHQFCRLGRLSFLSGTSGTSKDIPPFIIQQNINQVVGVNIIGMRRAGLSSAQINAIRRVYHIMYLQHLSVPNALAEAEAELGHIDVVQEFLRFVRESKRGINGCVGAPPDVLEMAA